MNLLGWLVLFGICSQRKSEAARLEQLEHERLSKQEQDRQERKKQEEKMLEENERRSWKPGRVLVVTPEMKELLKKK